MSADGKVMPGTHEARIQIIEEKMERYEDRAFRAELLWWVVMIGLAANVVARYCMG